MHTMQLMVEQERRYVEQVRQDLATSNSAKLQMELESAVKRLTKLEQQLDDLKAGKVSGILRNRFTSIFRCYDRNASCMMEMRHAGGN